MRIVDIKKFSRMLVVIIGVIIGISFFLTMPSYSKGEVKTKTTIVSRGDTLWTIAKYEQENNSYYENKDIRDIISEIKQINEIKNCSNIQEGEKILIYTF